LVLIHVEDDCPRIEETINILNIVGFLHLKFPSFSGARILESEKIFENF
jgi:hypothetical protein